MVGTGVGDDSASPADVGAASVAGTPVGGTWVAGTVASCGDDTVPVTSKPQAVATIVTMIDPRIICIPFIIILLKSESSFGQCTESILVSD
jgi:hypothetical protein